MEKEADYLFYVGIDVSKKTLDACILDQSGKEVGYYKIDNNLSGFSKLNTKLRQHLQKLGPDKQDTKFCHVCMEATGIYSVEVAAYFVQEAYAVSVVNPSTSAAFLKTQLRRTKTDKTDAHGLSLYGLKLKPKLFKPVPSNIRILQRETRFLLTLIEKQTSFRREKESLTSEQKQIFDELIQNLEKKIEAHRQLIRTLIAKDPAHVKAVSCLTSVPGIGEQTAWTIISEILYDSESGDVIQSKQQVAHAGLSPQDRQSGSSVKSPSHISKTGNRILRRCLFFPTLTAIRRCDSIAAVYDRLLKNGKPKKVALVASMRKLLCLAVTLLQKQTPFVPAYLSASPLSKTSCLSSLNITFHPCETLNTNKTEPKESLKPDAALGVTSGLGLNDSFVLVTSSDLFCLSS